jgi:hypothetical protein
MSVIFGTELAKTQYRRAEPATCDAAATDLVSKATYSMVTANRPINRATSSSRLES